MLCKQNRRAFLQSLSSTIFLPAMASLGNKPDSPLRLLCIGTELGMHPDSFIPENSGKNFELSPLLKPLSKHKKELSFISGFNHPGMKGSHGGVHAWLSGVTKDKADSFQEGNITIDQKLAEELGYRTRFPSLEFGFNGQVSWTRNSVPLPPMDKPQEIFKKLFLKDDPKAKIQQRRLLSENKSILDEHLDNFKALNAKLDSTDQAQFEQYQTSIRELEKKIIQQQKWFDIPKPVTNYQVPSVSQDITEIMPVMYDLILLALQTDSTRFITFSLGQGMRINSIEGVTEGYHPLSHHGKDPKKLKQLLSIESFFMKELSVFAEKMKKVIMPDGKRLFDSTQTLFGSGLGNASSHSSRNLPSILLGGNFKHSLHLKTEIQKPLCNLYTAILHSHGLHVEKFGTSDGTLSELI